MGTPVTLLMYGTVREERGFTFDNIYFVVINDILNIHQPNNFQFFCQTSRIVHDRILDPFGEILGRI